MDAMAGAIREKLGWNVHTPQLGEAVTLTP
jgi:hypothetical protein